MKYAHYVAFSFLIIGGLNWLLFGILGWEVGAFLGGMDSLISKAIYVLVGLSAVYEIIAHKKHCKECEGKPAASAAPNM